MLGSNSPHFTLYLSTVSFHWLPICAGVSYAFRKQTFIAVRMLTSRGRNSMGLSVAIPKMTCSLIFVFSSIMSMALSDVLAYLFACLIVSCSRQLQAESIKLRAFQELLRSLVKRRRATEHPHSSMQKISVAILAGSVSGESRYPCRVYVTN